MRHPRLSQRQLSLQLGVSLENTYEILRSPVDEEWIKVNNFQLSNNNRGYAYLLTPSGVVEKATITSRCLKREYLEGNKGQIEMVLLQ